MTILAELGNTNWNWLKENAGPILTLVTIAGLVIPRVRKWIQVIARKLQDWIDPDGCQFRGEVRKRLPLIDDYGRRIESIEYALYNNGETGVLNHVAKLVARDYVNFEHARYPGFESDPEGQNLRVTGAYVAMVGVHNRDSLLGTGWENCLHGQLADHYKAKFREASSSRRNFVGDCDFKHPVTGDHRGRWRFYAVMMEASGKEFYAGRAISALDDEARRIAREEGMDVNLFAHEQQQDADPTK